MSFKNNNRKLHEERMRPAIDLIYRSFWPDSIIHRYDREDELLLDIHHAIDTKITLPNGMILTAQEKSLTYQYSSFETVTLEYYNIPPGHRNNYPDGKEGDWFHLASQLYFCGYSNEDKTGFCKWVLLNWGSVILATQRRDLYWSMPRDNSKTRAQANFVYVKMGDIPDYCIVGQYGI